MSSDMPQLLVFFCVAVVCMGSYKNLRHHLVGISLQFLVYPVAKNQWEINEMCYVQISFLD
jgi:hypothetical protein